MLFCLLQECFSAGYASFNLDQVQYSTSTAAGNYQEVNKYDPKAAEKFGSEGTKVRQMTFYGFGQLLLAPAACK
jgi:hypothetical protein